MSKLKNLEQKLANIRQELIKETVIGHKSSQTVTISLYLFIKIILISSAGIDHKSKDKEQEDS